MPTEKKVHLKRRPSSAIVPGWETVEVPGATSAYTFFDGIAWYDEPIAKILIDAGAAELVPESPVIFAPTAGSIELPPPAVRLPDVPGPGKPKAK